LPESRHTRLISAPVVRLAWPLVFEGAVLILLTVLNTRANADINFGGAATASYEYNTNVFALPAGETAPGTSRRSSSSGGSSSGSSSGSSGSSSSGGSTNTTVATDVTATAWPYTGLVSFTPPTDTSGKTVTGFHVNGTNVNFVVGSGTSSPILVQGVNGIWGSTPTSFTVTTDYSDGTTSAPSAASNMVAPPGGLAPSTSPNVYADGMFYWKGDFSFNGTPAYGDTSGDPEGDAAGPGSYDVKWTSAPSGGGWQPYAPAAAYDLHPYKYLQVDLKPTTNGKTWIIYFEKVGDVGVGAQISLPSDSKGTYGPTPVAGQWATYKIPLANMNVGPETANPVILKFCIADGGPGSNVWYVNNVKFTAN
jgi:hypothetical protein